MPKAKLEAVDFATLQRRSAGHLRLPHGGQLVLFSRNTQLPGIIFAREKPFFEQFFQKDFCSFIHRDGAPGIRGADGEAAR